MTLSKSLQSYQLMPTELRRINFLIIMIHHASGALGALIRRGSRMEPNEDEKETHQVWDVWVLLSVAQPTSSGQPTSKQDSDWEYRVIIATRWVDQSNSTMDRKFGRLRRLTASFDWIHLCGARFYIRQSSLGAWTLIVRRWLIKLEQVKRKRRTKRSS